MSAASKAAVAGIAQQLDGLADTVEEIGRDVETVTVLAEGGFEDTAEQFDKTHAKIDTLESKVDKTNATLNDTGEKLASLVSAMWGAGGMIALGLAALAFTPSHGSRAASSSAECPSAAPRISVNVGSDLVAEAVKARLSYEEPEPWMVAASGETGEKLPPERYLPNQPFPGQKKPPCDARLSEEAINGGCWTPILRQPPCALLFRYGNTCYRPIATDPKQPVGTETQQCHRQ